jgi:hypothetical protein
MWHILFMSFWVMLFVGMADDWIWLGRNLPWLLGQACSNVVASKLGPSLPIQVHFLIMFQHIVGRNERDLMNG